MEETLMGRARVLTIEEAKRAIRTAIKQGIRPSHSALAAHLKISPRTMARYVRDLKLRVRTCPTCHGSGYLR
jgi:Mn-dependent DtxR family transcriptional regulator